MASVAPGRRPKVVLIGSTGVGKTSILLRQTGSGFSNHINPTIGASFVTSRVLIDGTTIELQIWDTAGQERFRAMAPMYYRNADAAILVYDITCEMSFRDVKSWAEELQRNLAKQVTLFLFGNKSDLIQWREVTEETGKSYAQSIGASFYETSALNGAGIEQAFMSLAYKLLNQISDETIQEWGDSGQHDLINNEQKRSCC